MTVRLLVLDDPNHDWDSCVAVLAPALRADGLDVDVTPHDTSLDTRALASYDAVVMGGGLTHRVGPPAGLASRYVPALEERSHVAILDFVRGGGGFLGFHIAGWSLGPEDVALIGGSSSMHPATDRTTTFEVTILAPDHPVTDGVGPFELTGDEIYQPAWDPDVTLLAATRWDERDVPVMWVHQYGTGRVFYASPGHRPSTFESASMQQLIRQATRWVAREGERA